jgi:hypothetical protein
VARGWLEGESKEDRGRAEGRREEVREITQIWLPAGIIIPVDIRRFVNKQGNVHCSRLRGSKTPRLRGSL